MATIYRTTAILPLFASALPGEDYRVLIALLASLSGCALFFLYGWTIDRLLRPHRDNWCREQTRDGKDEP